MKIQTEPFRKVTASSAAEICALVDLPAEATRFLVPDLSPQAFLSLLAEAEQVGNAVRFLAFALPVREAIWWAAIVAQSHLATPTALERACLERAAAWVYDPSDEKRRAAMELAETAKFEGAAAYAALAVFWSGGSLAPVDLPEVLPDPRLGHIGAGASVLLSLTAGDPMGLARRFEAALTRGIDIANGGNGWLKDDRPILSEAEAAR